LNPLPVQRPIPIWFGGHADAVLERTARLGDGWLPGFRTAAAAREHLDRLAAFAERHNRAPGAIGLEPRLHWSDGPDTLAVTLEGWRAAGAGHISLNTMGAGLTTPDEHLSAVRRFAEQLL
jgi:alkanesulfonate monooxygenase SsuD/methylene tetrahydromethanopterin reductase-like flavin-dependent oxidoreductase (luciferase family)